MTIKNEKLELCSLNCRGLANNQKRRSIFHWLKQKHKSLTLLQETHSTPEIESIWAKEWGGEIIYNHGTNKSKGVAILIPNSFDVIVKNVIRDDHGRILIVTLHTPYTEHNIANVYLPTKDNQTEQITSIETLTNMLNTMEDKSLIIGGDFNICQNPIIDKLGGPIENRSKAANFLETFKNEFNLVDAWRLLNNDSKIFTRRQMSKAGLIQSRLDFWLISKYMLYDMKSCTIHPSIKTDHSLIKLDLKLIESQQRGKGFFKLNTQLLTDKNYVNIIKEKITDFIEINGNIENKAILWDSLKCHIRGATISYASYKAKLKAQREKQLLEDITSLEVDLKDINLEEYYSKKQELEEIYKERVQGHIIRAKAKYVEYNEKSNKHFLQQEISNYKNKHIRKLIVNKETITKPDDILKEEFEFYKALYTEPNSNKEINDESYFENLPNLDDEQKNICDSSVTLDEVCNSVKNLPNNKTPGTDGLPIEFYKIFWNEIKHLLYDSYNYSFNEGILSLEQRRGIINIIPKKDKDLCYLQNWRPLSLLNTDYKILTKLLSIRLQKVISTLISDDQTGYLKGRNIGENIRKTLDVLQYTNSKNIPGILLQLDFQKAFDSISWNFLYKTLAAFNFGIYFQNWIKLIYNKPVSCVTNNGYSSDFFEITRGIRQGCPISGLLFLLVVEIMSRKIKQNKNINGIQIDKIEIKISQFADDTTLFLRDLLSVKQLLILLDDFAVASGLKLNASKTEAVWLGRNVGNKSQPLGLKWNDSFFKCLGIWCHWDVKAVIRKNYGERIQKIKNILTRWKNKLLSLKGKITIIWNLALPQILYLCSITYTPRWVIDEVDSLLFKFLWSEKKPHVKRETIIANIKDGGLRMLHFESMVEAIKIKLIKKLYNDENNISAFAKIVSDSKLPFSYIIRNNVGNQQLGTIKNCFYKQVLASWFKIYKYQPKSYSDIMNTPLFFNTNIQIGKKTLIPKMWVEKNILFIYDIIRQNGKFKTKREIDILFNTNLDQMVYNSITDAVPKIWIKTIKQSNSNNIDAIVPPLICVNGKNISIYKLSCKDAYNIMLSYIIKTPTSVKKWKEHVYVDDNMWAEIYQIPYKVCQETLIQSFQYKILNRFFPCNYQLSIWYNENNAICNYCETLTDTISHYFFECQNVKLFWESFTKWWKALYGFNVILQTYDVVFGINNEDNDVFFDVMNFCILYGKWYVHKIKVDGKPLCFFNYLQFLKMKLKCLKFVYLRKHMLNNFEQMLIELYDKF